APNIIGGETVPAHAGTFEKLRPADGTFLCRVARSAAEEVEAAVSAAVAARPAWAARTPVERGELVREIALALRARRAEAAEIVAADTGKPLPLALRQPDAAGERGLFLAGAGRRL